MRFLTYIRFASLFIAIPCSTLISAHVHQGRSDSSKTYSLEDWYQGSSFLSEWSFFVGSDPTNGNVNYVSMQDAQDQRLAYADGNAIVLAVDSTSNVPAGGNRNSVRITSNKSYNSGLFILDAAKMPVGCGVWPSIWTNGPNWPMGGEIDIVEGINNQANNQMTLHSGTSHSCKINTANGKQFTGRVLHADCYSTQNADSGCSFLDSGSNSFGPGFNNVQGGVFAFLWDPSSGMSLWHFSRANIPSDITNQAPIPANWGTPAGFWSAATCDIQDNFYNHQIIIDTTICGGWAGGAYASSGCPGTCSEMVANTANFENAQWRINYIAVYQ